MKRYIKSYGFISSLGQDRFEGNWSDEEKQLWESIDWKARNYKEYIVEDDVIDGRVRCVGLDLGRWIPAKFAKHIYANRTFPPCYEPIEEGELGKILAENRLLGPMYDGDDYHGYHIHNRYETPEVYDMLSR